MVMMGFVDAISIFSLAPIIDFLINQNDQNFSGIGKHVIQLLSSFGFPITLESLIGLFLFINILRSGFAICAKYSILRTKYTILKRIMVTTYETFFNSNWQFFYSSKQGTLLNTFTREMQVIGNSLGAIANLAADIIKLLIYVIVPIYVSWIVTSVSMISALVFAIPFLFLGRYSRKFGKLSTSTGNRITSIINEGFTAAKVILGFSNQEKSTQALSIAIDDHCDATIKSQTLNSSIPLIYFPLGVSVMAIAVYTGQALAIPIAEIVVLLYAYIRILPIIGNITTNKNALDNFFPSYEQITDLRAKAEKHIQKSGNKLFEGFNHEIKLTNLFYSYPNRKDVLVDINVIIPKGKMIALVGESGAGKTTLVDTIMGFNEPSSGEFTIDGIPFNTYDIISYRRKLGYVPQESILFNTTIKNNLLWAKHGASKDETKSACIKANAYEFIEKLPHRFDTITGDRGVRLSGGQIQRIALARAILKEPEILILDEATSSLDSHSETLFQKAIDRISQNTTIIVVAHRLSTIRNADYIYYFSNGKIIEEGAFNDLMSRNTQFMKIAELQGIL